MLARLCRIGVLGLRHNCSNCVPCASSDGEFECERVFLPKALNLNLGHFFSGG